MTDFVIRECREADRASLKAIWAECFGDPEQMVDSFLNILPRMGFGLCAELEGEIAGAAYMIEGMSVGAAPCAYLYAVGVLEKFRGHGLGSAISRACKERAKERGAEIICTQPAQKSLYKWYESIIGTKHRLYRRRTQLEAAFGKAESLSAKEYCELRESFLAGREHMKASLAAIEFERELCLAYGGDLFRTEAGIAAAYIEDGACHIKELLTSGNKPEEAAAVAAALETERAVLWEPAEQGSDYIAFDNGKMNKNCVWNISFD